MVVKVRSLVCGIALAVHVATAVGAPAAGHYPSKPIRVIIPFAQGGTTDLVARIVVPRMSQVLGQPMIIDNKGGAGGAIGATEAAQAVPDGYTLSMATVSSLAANPACRPKSLPYDPLKDFQPITNFANTPNILAVNSAFPAKDFKDLIKKLKKYPGRYSYGSSGLCGALHLMGESFKMATGTDIVHVPYQGSGPAIADTVDGEIEMIFDNLPSSLPQIHAGKLRPLAVSWPRRIPNLKDVPTFEEMGYPILNRPAWFGLLAPAGTPREIVDKLHHAAVIALQDPKVIKALEDRDSTPAGSTPEAFAKDIKERYDWAKNIVRTQNIELK
jgi:tripartite-type tricarboxylate transporter receptor subunit TctC